MQVPAFATEAEEAQWWFEHQDDITAAFIQAGERGELGDGSVARIMREQDAREGSTVSTTPDLDAEDFLRAQELAHARGLQYQSCLKSLIHDALEAE